ncbi:unnamed protein product [Lota lota]
MAQNLFLLFSMVMVCLTPGIHGTSHLTFANSTGQVKVTWTGCGVNKVCMAQPPNCEPMGNGSCLFTSVAAGPTLGFSNDRGLIIKLRSLAGPNEYIAVGLTVNASMETTILFICARVNETEFRFFTRDQNNSDSSANLSSTQRPVNNILGNINGNVLKCEFTVPNVIATLINTSFTFQIGNGTLVGGDPGRFSAQMKIGPLKLPDSASTFVCSSSPASFVSPASLLIWSVLAWPALLRM